MTEDDTTTDEERAADEAARVADPVRWQLAQRDRGALAQRVLDGISHHYPSTDTPKESE